MMTEGDCLGCASIDELEDEPGFVPYDFPVYGLAKGAAMEDELKIQLPSASAAERRHKQRYSADVSAGHVQCPYRVRVGDSMRCCVLREGHPGMHCHGYKTPSPREGWRNE